MALPLTFAVKARDCTTHNNPQTQLFATNKQASLSAKLEGGRRQAAFLLLDTGAGEQKTAAARQAGGPAAGGLPVTNGRWYLVKLRLVLALAALGLGLVAAP